MKFDWRTEINKPKRRASGYYTRRTNKPWIEQELSISEDSYVSLNGKNLRGSGQKEAGIEWFEDKKE